MVVSIICAVLSVPTMGASRSNGLSGRAAMKAAALSAAVAAPQTSKAKLVAKAPITKNGTSACLYVNSNLSPDPDFDPETEDPVVSNAVEAFTRDTKTGTLAYVGRFDTGGLGDPFVGGFQQHSIVSTGKYLYAVNPGDNTVSAFEVLKDCSLRLIEAQPTGGEKPVSIAVSGDLLYVANAGHSPIQEVAPASYTGFRIGHDGSLSPLACPAVPATPGTFGNTLADVVFNKTGDVLIGTGLLPNVVESFQVDRNGCLADVNVYPGGGGPFGALFSPAKPQQLFITTAVPELFSGPEDRAPGVDSYLVNKDGGLNLVDFFKDFFDPNDPAGSDEALRDPCWLAITQNGEYLWTSSFIPGELTLFKIDKQGNISKLSVWDPEDTIPNPDGDDFFLGSTDIAVDQTGKYLYQLRVFDVASMGERPLTPQIHVLRITNDVTVDGGLELVQVVTLPEDLSLAGTMGIAIVGPGKGK